VNESHQCLLTEERIFELEDETDRVLATWDHRWRNIPDGTSCSCGSSHPFVLFPRGDGVLCAASIEESHGDRRNQEQHLGGDPTPITPAPGDANEQRLLTDLQRFWQAMGYEPGSRFAIGFDVGAYLVIHENVR
jgi:hypothetical protein